MLMNFKGIVSQKKIVFSIRVLLTEKAEKIWVINFFILQPNEVHVEKTQTSKNQHFFQCEVKLGLLYYLFIS